MRARDITIALAISFYFSFQMLFGPSSGSRAQGKSSAKKKKRVGGGEEKNSKKNRMGDGNSVAAVESARGVRSETRRIARWRRKDSFALKDAELARPVLSFPLSACWANGFVKNGDAKLRNVTREIWPHGAHKIFDPFLFSFKIFVEHDSPLPHPDVLRRKHSLN